MNKATLENTRPAKNAKNKIILSIPMYHKKPLIMKHTKQLTVKA